ncbi:unnamed protein product, partial [Hapterophycus canaliculatus]
RKRGAISVPAILGSGAHFTSLSQVVVEQLERFFPGELLRLPFSLGARRAVTASGQQIAVTERPVPLQLALRITRGPATLPPIPFAIMPGPDAVVLLGLPTIQDLGIDPLLVKEFQQTGGQVAEDRDEAVECLAEQGPEMFMEPAEEESARKVALEEGVTNAVAAGLSKSKSERLRGFLGRRCNKFRRALWADPPARVEPMRVQLKPGASAVKAKPRRNEPEKA